MTHYDQLKPVAKKLVDGLAAKPGVKIVDRQIAADFIAQALYGMIKREEITLTISQRTGL